MEDTGSVTVTVQVVGTFARQLFFTVSIVDDLDTRDFITNSYERSLQPGSNAVNISISIVPDAILEFNESFSALLESNDSAVLIPDNQTSIVILNDDSKEMRYIYI